MQATFLEITRSAPQFDGERAGRAGFYGVATILLRRHRKLLRRARERISAWAGFAERAPATPAELFERDEAARRFERAFHALSKKKREVFVLMTLEGLSGEEASSGSGRADQHGLDAPASRSARAARGHRSGGAMRAICAQAWQVEAVEDGRLSGAERESFERHAATCAECRHERLVLAELRAAAGRLPLSQPTPLERRRQRQLLLRRASELGQRSGEPFRRWPVLALALLAVGVGLFEFSRSADAPRPPVETVAAPAPTYRLSATSGTRWRILESGEALRLRLDIGDVELQVDKLSARQRFVLELPDGEVEVVGTRFRAVASALGTEQVRVSEGRVALRLARRAPLYARCR